MPNRVDNRSSHHPVAPSSKKKGDDLNMMIEARAISDLARPAIKAAGRKSPAQLANRREVSTKPVKGATNVSRFAKKRFSEE